MELFFYIIGLAAVIAVLVLLVDEHLDLKHYKNPQDLKNPADTKSKK